MNVTPQHRFWAAVALLAVGAGPACAPAIEVQRVSPRRVVEASGTVVQVVGTGFQYTFNTFTGEANADFDVHIGTTRAGVSWVDATELAVTVPESLVPGDYDVAVTWDGATDALADALTVLPASSAP